MRFVATIILITIGSLSCKNRNEIIIPNDIISVKVYINKKNLIDNRVDFKVDSFVVTNRERISSVARLINTAKFDHVKFMPIYELHINCKDTTIIVGVDGKYCKIDGRSFIMKKAMKKYLQ